MDGPCLALWRTLTVTVQMIPPLARSVWPLIQPHRTGKEGNRGGDVFGLTEPFQWSKLGEPVDDFLWLPAEEQVGRSWTGRHGVDADARPRSSLAKTLVIASTPALVAA